MLKKCAALLCGLAFFVSLPIAIPTPSEAASITITIYIGKPRSCEGFGICRITIGWDATATQPPASGERRAAVRKCRASASLRGNKLFVDLSTPLPEKAAVIPLTENLVLDAPTSKKLGFKSVTVLQGEYAIDYSKNKFGSFFLTVESRN